MNKIEWEQAYKEFDTAHTELEALERDYKYGSNKKIRDAASRNMESVKYRVEYLFRKYPEVYHIVVGGEKTTDFGKAIVMDEFFQNRYIVADLGGALASMREKIKSLEDTNGNDQM